MATKLDSTYRFGIFELDPRCGELRKNGIKLKIQEQPLQVLVMLLAQPGAVVTRDELRNQLWPADTFVDFDHSINAAIKRLREALSDEAENPRFIETLPRRGYRFIAPVGPPAQLIAAGIAERKPRRPIVFRFTLAAIAAALLASVTWYFVSGHVESSLPPLRVIPLTSLPDQAGEAAFSPDGNRVAFGRHSDSPELSGIYIKQIGTEYLLQVTRSATDFCPAWSPDGRYLAFSRYGKQEHSIYLVSTLGGAERKLYSGAPAGPPLDWSPDGKFLAFSAADLDQGRYTISLLRLETLETRKLSEPTAGYQDWGPAFSPDGKQLAFVRSSENLARGEIFIMPANGGGARRLTFDDASIPSPPAWARDGQSIVFSSSRSGLPTVWRIPVSGGTPVQVAQVGVKALRPTVAPSGHGLAYEQAMGSSSIWSQELAGMGKKDSRRQVTNSKGSNRGAELSPDGTKIVFVSDRSGNDEIYVCDKDGMNLLKLTNLGSAHTPGPPRWSPDGQKFVFDAALGGHTAIFVIQANGGLPRLLTDQASDNLNPSWSRDGDWIYFTSNRSGQWQIWKMPGQGGDARQLTRQGGFAGFESADGKTIYYAKTSSDPDIWKMKLEDGQEAAVSPRLHLQQWPGWALADKGIFFVREGHDEHPVLRYFDFATARLRDVTSLEKQGWPLWISASADGKFVVYQQVDMVVSNIMLLENFR